MKIEFALNNYSDLELYDFVKKEGQSNPKRLTLLLKEVLRLLSIKKEREEYCIEYEQPNELDTCFSSGIREELKILKIHIPKLETLKKFISDELKESESKENKAQKTTIDCNVKNQKANAVTEKWKDKAVEIYFMWKSFENSREGYKNIFLEVDNTQFLEMVELKDFRKINKRGNFDRLKYTIFLLSEIPELGKNWGESVAKNLDTTLRHCSGRTDFLEYSEIKKRVQQ